MGYYKEYMFYCEKVKIKEQTSTYKSHTINWFLSIIFMSQVEKVNKYKYAITYFIPYDTYFRSVCFIIDYCNNDFSIPEM